MSYRVCWQGRTDTEDGERGERWHQRIVFESGKDIAVNLVGYPNDAGVAANKGRTGTAQGPDALRRMLANLPCHFNGHVHDWGNTEISAQLNATQVTFSQSISQALKSNKPVIGLGGGHDIALASYQGYRQYLGAQARIGIINFDAHLDLRKPSPEASSGTPFRQIAECCIAQQQAFHYSCLGVSRAANTPALFDYATFTQTRILLDTHFTAEHAVACVTPMLQDVDALYVTVCMDAFPAAQAPGVSAPSALGISVSETLNVIQWLGRYCQQHDIAWQLSDIAELNPQLDIDNRTARLAARVAFELVEAMSLKA